MLLPSRYLLLQDQKSPACPLPQHSLVHHHSPSPFLPASIPYSDFDRVPPSGKRYFITSCTSTESTETNLTLGQISLNCLIVPGCCWCTCYYWCFTMNPEVLAEKPNSLKIHEIGLQKGCEYCLDGFHKCASTVFMLHGLHLRTGSVNCIWH